LVGLGSNPFSNVNYRAHPLAGFNRGPFLNEKEGCHLLVYKKGNVGKPIKHLGQRNKPKKILHIHA